MHMAKKYSSYKGNTFNEDDTFDEFKWIRTSNPDNFPGVTATKAASVFKPIRRIVDIQENDIQKLLVLAGIPKEKLSIIFRDSIVDNNGVPTIITELVILEENETKQVIEESCSDELVAYNKLVAKALLILADTHISVRQRIALKMLMNNFCVCLNPLIKFDGIDDKFLMNLDFLDKEKAIAYAKIFN